MSNYIPQQRAKEEASLLKTRSKQYIATGLNSDAMKRMKESSCGCPAKGKAAAQKANTQ